ncbi:MAG: S9 family peptidase, partial [Myxococcales bacterium]|nr:S9 family peptidase [Myxococcales bacterium]
RVQATFGSDGVSFGGVKEAGGHYIAYERKPPKQQPFLIVTDSLDDLSAARTLVDPNEIDGGGTTAIDFFEPSPDGSLLAVSLSKGGTESGDVHIIEIATGKEVFEVVPRVNGGTAGGSLAWLPDGKAFLYTRYPRGDERPDEDKNFYVQVYKHILGTSTDADTYEMGKDQPRIAEYDLRADAKSGRVLATIQNGDGGEFAHYLREADGTWKGFTKFEDKVISASFGPNDTLYVMSR